MNTSEVRIRKAESRDAATLARLRYEFRTAEDMTVEARTQFEQRCGSWMRERLSASTSWWCWVAEEQDSIVGHIWVHVFEKVPNPLSEAETHGYITNMYVCPSARGSSIGTRLLAAALDACAAVRVDSVILWATPPSRSLYARHGFGTSNVLMELSARAGPKESMRPTMCNNEWSITPDA